MADQSVLQDLYADNDLVAGDPDFLAAWMGLAKYGFSVSTTDQEINAQFDATLMIADAIANRAILDDANSTDEDKRIARLQLNRNGVALDATAEEIAAKFDYAEQIAQSKLDRDTVAGSGTLLAAADRLKARGLNGQSTRLAIASSLADPEELALLRQDIALVRATTVLDAIARLAARGLSQTSSDLDVAVQLIDATEFAARKSDRNVVANYDAIKIVDLEYKDSVFDVSIGMAKSFHGDLDLAFDLGDLPGVGSLFSDGPVTLEITTGGKLRVDADIDFDLNFTFDLSQIGDPKFLIRDDSQITFNELQIKTLSPIDLSGTVKINGSSVISLMIKGAEINVDLTGTISLAPESVDHTYPITDLVSDSALWNVDLLGSVDANLPLYFPTATLPMGGTTADLDGDGIADNALHLSAKFTPDGLVDLKYAVPDLNSFRNLFAILNNPATVLAGLEGMFGFTASLQSLFNEVGLPMVGNAFNDATDFLDDLREMFLGPKGQDGIYTSGLGKTLQDAAADGQSVVDLIKEALYNELGHLLKLQVLGSDGTYTYESLTSADDIQLVADANRVQFNVVIQGVVFHKEIPVDFGVSMPGLELNVDAKIAIDLSYVFALGLGINSTGIYVDTTGAAADDDEFKLVLSASLVNPPSGAAFEASLGFLQMQVKDFLSTGGLVDNKWGPFAADYERSALSASISVDLVDAGNDGKWEVTRGELVSVSLRLTAKADIDLEATIKIPSFGGLQFPQLHTVFHYSQLFADVVISTTGLNKATFGEAPVISFENVQLDLGEFISNFLKPIVDKVRDVTKPLDPIVKVLTTPIPLLAALGAAPDEQNLLGLGSLVMGKTKYAPVVKAVKAIAEALVFIKTVDDFINAHPGKPILISFGNFEIGGDMRTAGASKTSAPISSGPVSDPNKTPASSVTKKIGTTKGSFRFPLLTDPSLAFGLLTGKDVTLFIYDLPKLELEFEYIKSFPIFPGLNVRFGGNVKATTNFSFGFDTRGINEWRKGWDLSTSDGDGLDFDLANAYKVANGFFLDDHIVGGVDQPEVTLSATIIAGASLGLGGLVEAGAQGNITMTINFDLNDKPAVGPDPDHPWHTVQPGEEWGDGKMRFVEVKNRVVEGPQCLFDMSGALTVGLDAFLWIGLDTGFFKITLFDETFNIFRATLFSFNLQCRGVVPPTLANDSSTKEVSTVVREAATDTAPAVYYKRPTGGVLTLNSGSRASYRGGDWNSYDTKGESFTIGNEMAPDGTTNVTTVGFQGFTEYYVGVTSIIGYGGSGPDEFVVAKGVTATIEFHGGDGNDSMRTNGSGAAKFYGDGGDDVLVGAGGNDEFDGGSGDDRMDGGAGNDLLLGGSGDDVILGGDGNDRILGGDESNEERTLWNDATGGTFKLKYKGQITGAIPYNAPATGANSIESFIESLTIDGTNPSVSVSGLGTQTSPWVIQFTTSGGPDGVVFEAIDADDAATPAFGLTGQVSGSVIAVSKHGDRIKGGAGTDEIYAGAGSDAVSGDDGNDWIEGGTGDDRILGGPGDDVIVGGDGNDIITGGMGADLLVGNAGDDTFNWSGVNNDDQGVNLGSDGVDSFLSAGDGQDGLNITTTNGVDNVDIATVNNLALTISKTTPLTNLSSTFTRLSSGVSTSISGGSLTASITATSIEKLVVNVLDGADIVTVRDLQGSGVEAFTTDLGLAFGDRTVTQQIQKTKPDGTPLYLTPGGVQTTESSGNVPDYVMIAARDSNGNTRLYAGSVAGTVAQQIEQKSVITPTGTPTLGDVWTVDLATSSTDKVRFEYTVLANDTLATIASALRALIDANASYNATLVDVPTDDAPIKGVEITLVTGGKSFTVALKTISSDGKSPSSGEFTQNEIPFEKRLQTAEFSLSSDANNDGTISTVSLLDGAVANETISIGEVWSVTLNGEDYLYTTVVGDTLASIEQGLNASINAAHSANIGDLKWHRRVLALPTTLAAVGSNQSISIDSQTFNYQVKSTDLLADANNQLILLIDADSELSASSFGDGLIAVERSLGKPTYEASVSNSVLTVSNWQTKTYNLVGTVQDGDIWTVVVDTTTLEYTVIAGDTLETIAYELAQKIDALQEFQASQANQTSLVIARPSSAITPTVTFSTPEGGQAATGTLTIANGTVTGITITSGGSGYLSSSPPIVSFSAAPWWGTLASGTAVISDGGSITGVTITSGGSGYNTVVPPFTASIGRSFSIPSTIQIKIPNVDANGNLINDLQADRVYLYGNASVDDQFSVESTENTITATRRIGSSYVLAYEILNPKRSYNFSALDTLKIYGDSDVPNATVGTTDTLDASSVVNDLLAITLDGGAGNDRLIGSDFDDTLDGGLGDDEITGGAGVDTFIDAGGNDTLIEERDWDM